MAASGGSAFSTSLTADVAMRVKMIAHRENRSAANVIESAVKAFTLLPKEVRDVLLDASSDPSTGGRRLAEIGRRIMYQDAVQRLDEAPEPAGSPTAWYLHLPEVPAERLWPRSRAPDRPIPAKPNAG